LQGWC